MAWDPKLPIDPVHRAVQVEGVSGGVPIPVQGVAGATSDVTLHDNVTTANHLAINASGQAAIQNPPNLDAAASTLATQATLALIKAKTDNLDVALSTRTKPADTQAVSAASLPLPTGAATATKQDTGNTSLASIDGKLTNPLPVSASSLPLPAGAATAARQDTGNVSLASIDAKLTNPLPVTAIGTVTANQGTAAAASSAWPVKITDTSDTAVKPGDATNNAIRVNVVATSGSTTFFGITESSTGDGVTTTLTLGHTPTDEPRVFVAGLRQILGTHYTRSGAVITWISIPVNGDAIQVDYTWSMASATLASTLVVDTLGNVQPTGDSSARTIHTTVDNPIFGTVESGSGQTATAIHAATQTPRGADVGLVVRQVPDTAFQQMLIGLLTEIRMEMRITNELLVEGLTLRKSHDPEQLRRDPTFFEPLSFSQPS